MADRFFVYILANLRASRPVLYTGVTGDLKRRLAEHQRSPQGFVARYKGTTLVYFECTANVLAALEREKQIKGWSRARKIALIEGTNPMWRLGASPRVGIGGGGVLRRCATQDDKFGGALPERSATARPGLSCHYPLGRIAVRLCLPAGTQQTRWSPG